MYLFYELIVYLGLICLLRTTEAEMDFFPGLRKAPQINTWGALSQDDNADLLARWTEIINRRRLQEQQRKQEQMQKLQKQYAYESSIPAQEMAEPGFTYQFPISAAPLHHNKETPFAISPADPRYYESSERSSSKLSNYDDDYQQLFARNEDGLVKSSDGIPSFNLKAPMQVNPKMGVNGNNFEHLTPKIREDIKNIYDELHKNGQEGAIINGVNFGSKYIQPNDVVRKHMEMDAAMGMYIVALIAGVSAAVTVGFIALGVGWYTLHKKAKAAADVEYPAYGVTGPNKEISPSGDRRLAQSAHMYHYQHQKQQIIAMENRGTGERNGASDVESDDENEEGDYTVYECPGLASTGEMEVKNPLFLDDPTPATPANATQSQQQQPTQQQQKPKTGSPPSAKNQVDGKKDSK